MSTDGFTILSTFIAAFLLLGVLVSKVRRGGAAVVAAVTAAAWVLVSPAPAVAATCTIVGTAKSETLNGTSGEDVICGFGGNDVINGNGGDDHLDGGAGNDRINGGPGNDVLTGGTGGDTLTGGPGDDQLDGGTGTDTVSYADHTLPVSAHLSRLWSVPFNNGSLKDATSRLREDDYIATSVENLTGGPGDDWLFGSPGPNVLVGGGGNDWLEGLAGDDKLLGGAGNDKLRGRQGSDILDGGGGVNSCDEEDPPNDLVLRYAPRRLPTDGYTSSEAGGDTAKFTDTIKFTIFFTFLAAAFLLLAAAVGGYRWRVRLRPGPAEPPPPSWWPVPATDVAFPDVPQPRPDGMLTEEELAYLVGGPARLAETVLAGLVADGSVRVNSAGLLSRVVDCDQRGHEPARRPSTSRARTMSRARAQLLAAIGSGMAPADRVLREVVLSPAAVEIKERLVVRRLLRRPWPPDQNSRDSWGLLSIFAGAGAFGIAYGALYYGFWEYHLDREAGDADAADGWRLGIAAAAAASAAVLASRVFAPSRPSWVTDAGVALIDDARRLAACGPHHPLGSVIAARRVGVLDHGVLVGVGGLVALGGLAAYPAGELAAVAGMPAAPATGPGSAGDGPGWPADLDGWASGLGAWGDGGGGGGGDGGDGDGDGGGGDGGCGGGCGGD